VTSSVDEHVDAEPGQVAANPVGVAERDGCDVGSGWQGVAQSVGHPLAGGEALKPGLYFPDSIIDPAYYIARMKEFGAVFTEANANG